ncbi:MAG TPA: hypothetical protein VGG60_07270 [Candidatus Binataceae bacterium]|jgi:hypothetical protein
MRAGYLTDRQIEILKSLRDKANERNKHLLESAINDTLPRGDIQAVCQTINDEYLMRGIEKDYTPSEYGRELEDLIDVVNRRRIL